MDALSNTFTAYLLLSWIFSARYTSPKAPRPSNDNFLKLDNPIYLIATWSILYPLLHPLHPPSSVSISPLSTVYNLLSISISAFFATSSLTSLCFIIIAKILVLLTYNTVSFLLFLVSMGEWNCSNIFTIFSWL